MGLQVFLATLALLTSVSAGIDPPIPPMVDTSSGRVSNDVKLAIFEFFSFLQVAGLYTDKVRVRNIMAGCATI